MDRRSLLALGLATPLARPALAQPRALAIAASATPSALPFHRADFATVGVFDIDWLTEPRFARALDHMAACPGAFSAVRVFGVLNAGTRETDFPTSSGATWTDPRNPPDFRAALAGINALVSRGLVAVLPLTFFPAAVSPHPITPPAEWSRWQALLRAFLRAAEARFGAAELSRWWLEAWNEPNMPEFWRGDFETYLDLYRATAEALRDSGLRLRLGGPVIAWMPPDEGPRLMERFLRFLAEEPEVPCDVLSFHRKGVWVEAEGSPRLDRLVEAAETTAELALRIVPDRCARGLTIVNDEADMRVGFQRPDAPRLDERHAAWLAGLAATHAALSAKYARRGLRFVAAADNANQQLVQAPFDGRRALFSPTAAARPADLVKLPAFAWYEMLPLMGDHLCAAAAPAEGLHLLLTADAARIAALLVRQAAGPDTVELALRDIPWPRVNLAVFRIDASHANGFAAQGRRMPGPDLAPAEARRLRAAAELAQDGPIRRALPVQDGGLTLPVRLPPFATLLAWITPAEGPPPEAPRWLHAAIEGGDAVLRWTPLRDPGLHGYELLRLDPPRRAAPVPLRGAMWVDTAPPRGEALRYAVRAVSASGLRSRIVRAPVLRA